MKSLAERQALLYPERSWEQNDAIEQCPNQRCKARFSVPRGVLRHHCKFCGTIFCERCCPIVPLRNGTPCSKYKFKEARKCNACLLPRVFRGFRHTIDGPLTGAPMDLILSFLDNKSINAYQQSCATARAEFHIPGTRYVISLQERFPSLFVGAKVGSGLSGNVFTVEDRTRGSEKVAVKVITKATVNTFYMWRKLIAEVTIMQEITHPNICAIYEVFQTHTQLVIVMQLGEAGSLRRVALNLRRELMGPDGGQAANTNAARKGNLSPRDVVAVLTPHQRIEMLENFVALMLAQVGAGLDHLHRTMGICHRDIKLDNIVVSKDYSRFMIIDFGLAERFTAGVEERHFVPCGTVGFASPENVRAVVNGTKRFAATREMMFAADVFSLGVMAFMVLSGQKALVNNKFQQQWVEICQGIKAAGRGWDGISDGARKLVEAMLHSSSRVRLTAAAIIAHPFVLQRAPQFHLMEAARRETVAIDDEEEGNEWVFVGVKGANLSDWGFVDDCDSK